MPFRAYCGHELGGRKAILLVAEDKSGIGERRFYRQLIQKADQRFDTHLDRLNQERRSR